MSYNLDENEQESWEFTLGGEVYDFRYPTTEETEKFNDFGSGDNVDIKGLMDYTYTFITPRTSGTPPIKETLQKSSIKKFQNFQKMILSELKVEIEV